MNDFMAKIYNLMRSWDEVEMKRIDLEQNIKNNTHHHSIFPYQMLQKNENQKKTTTKKSSKKTHVKSNKEKYNNEKDNIQQLYTYVSIYF